MKVGFIGAGKVGCSLGDYFVRNGISVAGFYSRTQAKAGGAGNNKRTHVNSIDKLLTMCDVLFLTVPDDAISNVWEQIRTIPMKGKYICHCSGSLSSAVLSGIKEAGAYGYSVHPMFPFKSKETAYEDLKQALFTVEGDEEHIDDLVSLISSCGNPVVKISSDHKAAYHAASVFGSNLMIGLMNQATELLCQCGFKTEEAMKALKPLAMTNLYNFFEVGSVDALTGPVERHDIKTIEKHLEAFDTTQKETYRALTKEIIKIAEKKHPEVSYEDMKQILEEEK